MPPVICCSPVLVDQSFPRDSFELEMVVDTLVKIIEQVSQEEILIGFTGQLAAMVESFEWVNRKDYAILYDIYRFLQQLVLYPFGVANIDVEGVVNYNAHPIPQGCEGLGLIEIWVDEMGRLLSRHDENINNDEYFIGIACESAYCRGIPRNYIDLENRRAFPLVGPKTIKSLDDAYQWVVSKDVNNKQVSLSAVFRHYKVIGSYGIHRPSGTGSSHYEMKFKGRRTWPLDANIDPVCEDHLKELIAITNFPLPVIKYALLYGELPPKKIRIS